jgi:hypothetical protein
MAQGQLVSGQLDTDSGEDSCTPTLPSGATAGNLIVVVARASAAGGIAFNTPTDFTAGPTEGATRGGIAMFAKIAVGGETAISVSATATASVGAIVAEYEGPFNGTTPWDASQTGTSGNSSVSSLSTGTTATLSQADELVVTCAGQAVSLNTTDSWTNSVVEETGGDLAFDLTTDGHISVASKIVAATTAVESAAGFSGNARAKAAIWTFELGAGGTPGSTTPAATAATLTISAASVVGGGSVSPAAIAASLAIPAVDANPAGNPGGLPDAAVIAFYDARDLAGSPTDPVSSWADSGPNSESALVQATGTQQPTITDSGFGGVRSVLFDGSNDELNVTLGASYTGDFAFILAVELLTYPTGTAAVVYSTGSVPNKNILGVDDVEDPPGWVVMSGDGTQPEHHHGTNDQTYLEATPSRFVMTQLVENANRLRLWENSVLVIDEAPASAGDLNNMGALKVGAREDATRYANCRVGAVLLVDMAQTDLTTLLAARDDLLSIFGVSGTSGSVQPAATSAVLTIPASSSAGGGVVTPGVVAQTVVIPQVTPAETGAVSPAAVVSPVGVGQVSTVGGATVTPAVSGLTLTVPTASPAGGGVVEPTQIGLAFTIPAATVAGAAVSTPAQIGLAFTLPTPSAVTGGAGSASPAQIVTAAVLDAVTAQGEGTVNVAGVTAVLTVPAVSASGGGVATPAQVAAGLTLPQAVAVGSGVVSPTDTTVSLLIPGVTVAGSAGPTPGTVELVVTVPGVSLSNTDGGGSSQEGELSLTFQEGGLKVSVQSGGLKVSQ